MENAKAPELKRSDLRITLAEGWLLNMSSELCWRESLRRVVDHLPIYLGE
jgi:hypothetical protein